MTSENQIVATCKAKHEHVEQEISDIKGEILRLWEKVDRLPPWAVWAMTFLGGIAGGFIGWAIRGAFTT